MIEAMTEILPQRSVTRLTDYQPPAYLIDETHLIFDLFDDHTLVTANLCVRHNRLSDDLSRKLVLNGEELTLLTLKINGQLLPESSYEINQQYLIIHDVPDHFELSIVTKIFPQKNTALSGLYCSRDTYCTQCEAEGFRRITYYLDRPDVLSRFTTKIIADEQKYPVLLSNGNLIKTEKVGQGRHAATWDDPFKKPSYLFALVAGDFDLREDIFVTQSNREVALKMYVEKGFADQTAHAMYSVKQAMRWDEINYGREYDLDIYMIVAIADFNMGAMENKGLNIFNTKYILAKPQTATDIDYIHIASVIGHEYFHNWSGNRVTCRDWFQLSLKEGLTIFRDQSFTEDLFSRAVMRIHDVAYLRETQFIEDAGPLAHPVRPSEYLEINNFYTATVYNKGAELWRMLQTIIGQKQFRKGMDLYFAQHDGQAATIEDLVRNMEDVSGVDLTQYRLWFTQAGTPYISVKDNYDAATHIYSLTISQACPPTGEEKIKLPMVIPIRMGLLGPQGEELSLEIAGEPAELEKILLLNEPEQTFRFENVMVKPLPSLLRGFSAPVKLRYAYTSADLKLLFTHDKDSFNRWNALQQYLIGILLDLVQQFNNNTPFSVPAECYQAVDEILKHTNDDAFLLAEMLIVPSERYLGEQMQAVDVDAIHAAREYLLTQLATNLEQRFVTCYKQNNTPNTFEPGLVGKRMLKNRCLSYAGRLPAHHSLVETQFNNALSDNMTDTIAALTSLVNAGVGKNPLERFYSVWKNDELVMDKWFAIQAASQQADVLQQVIHLMSHEAFDIKNPNKVYALIGAFGRNQAAFHARDGQGYAFLAGVVAKLDKLNPQVAARMINPLTEWRRYDTERQKLMRGQLENLLKDKNLSSDVFELITKSLT